MHICHISIYFLYACKKNVNVEKLYVKYIIHVYFCMHISAALIIIVETCNMMRQHISQLCTAYKLMIWMPRGLQFSQ